MIDLIEVMKAKIKEKEGLILIGEFKAVKGKGMSYSAIDLDRRVINDGN